jgi:hypothetical protein
MEDAYMALDSCRSWVVEACTLLVTRVTSVLWRRHNARGTNHEPSRTDAAANMGAT